MQVIQESKIHEYFQVRISYITYINIHLTAIRIYLSIQHTLCIMDDTEDQLASSMLSPPSTIP